MNHLMVDGVAGSVVSRSLYNNEVGSAKLQGGENHFRLGMAMKDETMCLS